MTTFSPWDRVTLWTGTTHVVRDTEHDDVRTLCGIAFRASDSQNVRRRNSEPITCTRCSWGTL